ncbi:MAG: ZIP family metal transporter [Actinomycetota bacterium]
MLILLLAATGTALATGLGAIPVFLLGTRAAALQPLLLGLAAGAMTVASVAGLILPGLDEGPAASVGAGLAAGALFLVGIRSALEARQRHVERALSASLRTSLLVFVVLLVHSLPEGFAIGTAYASDTAGLSLFVIAAIAVQNIPEGTSVAIPMAAAGLSRSRQFWGAVATSAPQPAGAAIAFLLVEEIEPLLPISFGFAAGAMLALVVIELAPSAVRADPRMAVAGVAAGAAMMMLLSWLLGV